MTTSFSIHLVAGTTAQIMLHAMPSCNIFLLSHFQAPHTIFDIECYQLLNYHYLFDSKFCVAFISWFFFLVAVESRGFWAQFLWLCVPCECNFSVRTVNSKWFLFFTFTWKFVSCFSCSKNFFFEISLQWIMRFLFANAFGFKRITDDYY